MDLRARNAAMSRYFDLRPEAVSDPLAASARVAQSDHQRRRRRPAVVLAGAGRVTDG